MACVDGCTGGRRFQLDSAYRDLVSDGAAPYHDLSLHRVD